MTVVGGNRGLRKGLDKFKVENVLLDLIAKKVVVRRKSKYIWKADEPKKSFLKKLANDFMTARQKK